MNMHCRRMMLYEWFTWKDHSCCSSVLASLPWERAILSSSTYLILSIYSSPAKHIVITIMLVPTNGLLENWKCLLACTLVSMSPFQYGIDFGAIGGLQAMPGFLQVRHTFPTHNNTKLNNPTRSSATKIPPSQEDGTSLPNANNSSPPS
jgi:hypothetical protein